MGFEPRAFSSTHKGLSEAKRLTSWFLCRNQLAAENPLKGGFAYYPYLFIVVERSEGRISVRSLPPAHGMWYAPEIGPRYPGGLHARCTLGYLATTS